MPPPRDDCPICFIRLPPIDEVTYQSCCGQEICNGCVVSMQRLSCPYCNTPNLTFDQDQNRIDQDQNEMLLERIEKYNDPDAMNIVGLDYLEGRNGFSINHPKAVELFRCASELGSANGHGNLGNSFTLREKEG